jgi:hypothetical protein
MLIELVLSTSAAALHILIPKATETNIVPRTQSEPIGATCCVHHQSK